MKSIYYFVTFVAALIVIGYAAWRAYENRDVIMKNLPNVQFGTQKQACSCCPECDCVACKCIQTDNKCVLKCKCANVP